MKQLIEQLSESKVYFIWASPFVDEITSYDLRSKLLEALWFCDAWLNGNIYWLGKSNVCASETKFIQKNKELWREAVTKKGLFLSLQAHSTIRVWKRGFGSRITS